MKRLFAMLLICFSILCCLSGCEYLMEDVTDENFYCIAIDENNVAVGNVRAYPEDGVAFFPEQIENYTVSKLGFASGLGFGGNGYLETNLKRVYFPHTIQKVSSDYMKLQSGISGNFKIFYCGEIVDLSGFHSGSVALTMEMYVPAEKYESFKNVYELPETYFKGSLLKANISYYLNYDENNYYYVDYYENGEKISYIPPSPQREGYTFGGWFKEADCINQWIFDTDTVQISEDTQEIQLYAQWIVEQ